MNTFDDIICNDPKCIFVRKGIAHKVSEHSKLQIEPIKNDESFQSGIKIEILSKIPFENEIDFITFNPKNNQVFVSQNRGNLISTVDFALKTKSKLVEVERPRDIIFSPVFSRVYAICGDMGMRKRNTGKHLCVIDVKTNQIIKSIGNKEGFGGLSRNSKTNKIYFTRPHKKKVWVLDEKSLDIDDKISVKGNYKQIIFNENTDDLILAGSFGIRGKHSISTYDNNTKKIRKIFSQTQWNYGESFGIKYFPKINQIFAYLATNSDDSGYSNTRIHILDYSNPDSKPRISSKNRILDGFDLDISLKFIYYLQISLKSKSSNYEIVKRNLATNTEEIFPYDVGYPIFSSTVFGIHPQTGNLVVSAQENKQFFLLEISPP